MKHVKISEDQAARIRNLLQKLAEADGSQDEQLKEQAKKLAAYMREHAMIKEADEQQIADMLSTHDGALTIARRGVDLEVEHRKQAKEASDDQKPKKPMKLGSTREQYAPDPSSKDRMKEASDAFEQTVLSASGRA